MKTFRILILMALVLWAQSAQAGETVYARVLRTGILRCGYVQWPPFFDVDPNTKKVFGFNADVMSGIGRMLQLKIEYLPIVLGQQVQDLQDNRVDAICGDSPWVLTTIRYLDYAQPYYYQGSYLYVREDEKRFGDVQALNDAAVTFAGIDGDVSIDVAMRRFAKAKIRSLASITDPSQLFMDVTTGKADAVIMDAQSADRFMKNNPGKIKRLSAAPLAVQGGGFAVRKGEIDLLNMLSEAVRAALNNGMIDDILKKYDPAGTLFLPVAAPYRSAMAQM